MNEIQKIFFIMFDHLESHKCLCKYSARDVWYQVYQKSFKNNDFPGRNNDQLLCISFIRLTGETYASSVLKYQCICSNIHQLFELFLSEDLWTIFIHHLKYSKDKYLVYTFIKGFSIILYSSNESIFIKRLHAILEDIKGNVFEEINVNVLDFLSNLVGFNFKLCEIENQILDCNNIVSNADFPFANLFQSLCTLLSQHWDCFMKRFYEITNSRTENQNLNGFLLLWQKLISRCLEQDLFHVYLNEQFVIAFLSNACNIGVVSLRIYVDIIMQFYISSLKMKPLQKNLNSLEEAVISALEKDFFNLLPCDIQISSFCTATSSNDNESSSSTVSHCLLKCDTIIVKKVAFIFLNIFTNIENKQLLSNALQKVFDFVKQNFDISSEKPVYRWILDVFIDQDDILLGVILALLRIYIILKEDTTNLRECTQLQISLNPHEIFISFLQKIGFDHNELLSFLVSDETCFLLYILQYLKLLLHEQDIFMKTHNTLIKADISVLNYGLGHTSMRKTSETSYVPPAKKLLVSYSSSSSEEDLASMIQIETKNQIVTHHTNCVVSHEDNFIAIETLIKLKQSIKKLVDEGEFPYNISPLLMLLQACEANFLSL